MKKMLKTEEVAKRLRHTPDTVRAMVKRGQIPAVRLGRKLLFSPDVIDAIVRGQPLPG